MDSVSIDQTTGPKIVPASPEDYRTVRRFTEQLTENLSPEDCVVQSMPDASPVKWHLAHTTWFFETFLLTDHLPGYCPFHPQYSFLFNSYYNAVGDRHPRPHRGLLTRPSLSEVREYRQYVDDAMSGLWELPSWNQLRPMAEIGLHHEQQHQELLLTDIKHLFAQNPLKPVFHSPQIAFSAREATPLEWVEGPNGVREIGLNESVEQFGYDNESPRHSVFLQPYVLGSRLITNGEYLEFLQDGGYHKPEFWLSDGWDKAKAEGWEAPLYWERSGGIWNQFTLSGLKPVNVQEPVCHISHYEADAYARWSKARLPTEAEWEAIAQTVSNQGNFADSRQFHPMACGTKDQFEDADSSRGGELEDCRQMLGDVWEWTQSPYTAYPGYSPPMGALGEYNGKFMCNQMVLRGGSCATSLSHIRSTYRNFFKPEARWQFSGLRLARDI